MRIIISPAKKMRTDTDSLPWQDLPLFLPQAERLLAALRAMDAAALQQLWQCGDRLARENGERLAAMDLGRGLTPALLSYQGIQYQYMAPGVFTAGALRYVQERLRILEALRQNQFKRSRAAAQLNMDRSTLWRKMKKYGLDRP